MHCMRAATDRHSHRHRRKQTDSHTRAYRLTRHTPSTHWRRLRINNAGAIKLMTPGFPQWREKLQRFQKAKLRVQKRFQKKANNFRSRQPVVHEQPSAIDVDEFSRLECIESFAIWSFQRSFGRTTTKGITSGRTYKGCWSGTPGLVGQIDSRG